MRGPGNAHRPGCGDVGGNPGRYSLCRMSSSWDHAVTRLDPTTVDEHDRWGRRCSTSRCTEPVTHVAGYRYVTGRAGRVSWAERRVCEDHAARFAQRYQVDIGATPAQAGPRPVDAQLPAVHRAELRRLPGHPAGGWQLSLARAGGGGLASWTVPKFTAAGGAGLDEAVHAADAFLARSRMLIAQVGWQRAGERATATLVPVTDTPAWRGISWVCTVVCDREALGTPTWYLEQQLSPQFDPLRHPLGNAGIDLDRAVRTAQQYLERSGWTLASEWTSSGHVAVVHAHPPARLTVTRPAPAPAAAAAPAISHGSGRPPAASPPAAISAVR